MKVRAKELSESERIAVLDALYTAAGSVRGREAMRLFLRDLLTESERIMLGRRILVARSILAQDSYDDIAERMHVGYDTIRRIGRWLDDQLPGYEQAIEKLNEELDSRQQKYLDRKLYATSALYRLKKKYPGHFLLFPWPGKPAPQSKVPRRQSTSPSGQ